MAPKVVIVWCSQTTSLLQPAGYRPVQISNDYSHLCASTELHHSVPAGGSPGQDLEPAQGLYNSAHSSSQSQNIFCPIFPQISYVNKAFVTKYVWIFSLAYYEHWHKATSTALYSWSCTTETRGWNIDWVQWAVAYSHWKVSWYLQSMFS